MTKKPGRPRGSYSSNFYYWIKDRDMEKLPRNYAALARMSRCSYEAVRKFFWNRRKDMRELLKTLPRDPKMFHPALSFTSVGGTEVFPIYAERIRYRFDPWTFQVWMDLFMGEGVVETVEIEDVAEFVKTITQSGKNGTTSSS